MSYDNDENENTFLLERDRGVSHVSFQTHVMRTLFQKLQKKINNVKVQLRMLYCSVMNILFQLNCYANVLCDEILYNDPCRARNSSAKYNTISFSY